MTQKTKIIIFKITQRGKKIYLLVFHTITYIQYTIFFQFLGVTFVGFQPFSIKQ